MNFLHLRQEFKPVNKKETFYFLTKSVIYGYHVYGWVWIGFFGYRVFFGFEIMLYSGIINFRVGFEYDLSRSGWVRFYV